MSDWTAENIKIEWTEVRENKVSVYSRLLWQKTALNMTIRHWSFAL